MISKEDLASGPGTRLDHSRAFVYLGKTEDRKRRGQQRMRCLDDIINAMNMSLSTFWETVRYREAWYAAVHGVKKSLT